MRTFFQRRQQPSAASPASLTNRIHVGRDWKQACQRFVTPTLRWIDTQPRPEARILNREVAEAICSAIPDLPPSAATWCRSLCLDSPALNRRLRIYLLDHLTPIGVSRNLSDLPAVTFHSTLGLLAAVRSVDGGDMSPLWALAEPTRQSGTNVPPTAADAFLLSELLLPAELGALDKAGPPAPLDDVLKLALWLHSLKTGSPTKMPANELTRSWLTATAFRGARRAWSRKMGANAGALNITKLPEGLKPSLTRLSEAYGSMLVEWALATIRHWPDRRELADHTPEVLQARTRPLIAEVRGCLTTVENGTRLIEWLRTSAAQMTLSDNHDWSRTFDFTRTSLSS